MVGCVVDGEGIGVRTIMGFLAQSKKSDSRLSELLKVEECKGSSGYLFSVYELDSQTGNARVSIINRSDGNLHSMHQISYGSNIPKHKGVIVADLYQVAVSGGKA